MSGEHLTVTTRPDRHHLEQCGICHAPACQPCQDDDTEHEGRRWHIAITAPRIDDGSAFGCDTLTPDEGCCRPTTESTDVWDHTSRDPRFPSESIREAIAHRGACLGCGWAGPTRLDENLAVEDAHDHAWPGWRALPIVPRQPHDAKARDLHRWRTQLAIIYRAAGLDVELWTQPAAPFRTARTSPGTRSHSTWHGGYDICGTITHLTRSPSTAAHPQQDEQLSLC